jgi:hypothetical protein
MSNTTQFPEFWYESNACWGNVDSFETLAEMAKLQIEENNGIRDIDDFLDVSVKVKYDSLNFGTRREHSSNYSLRNFLSEKGVLDGFVQHFKSIQK